VRRGVPEHIRSDNKSEFIAEAMQLGLRLLDIKPLYIEPGSPWKNGTVTYRSRMHAKTKRNFEIFSAEEFIAAITPYIPEKGFQMVRSYDWYSNSARSERVKKQAEQPEDGLWGQAPVAKIP